MHPWLRATIARVERWLVPALLIVVGATSVQFTDRYGVTAIRRAHSARVPNARHGGTLELRGAITQLCRLRMELQVFDI